MAATEQEKTPLQQKLDEFGEQLSKVGFRMMIIEMYLFMLCAIISTLFSVSFFFCLFSVFGLCVLCCE